MATGTDCDYGQCPRQARYRVTISATATAPATGQVVERRPACAQHVGPMCDAVPSGFRAAVTTLDSARPDPSTSLHVKHTGAGTLVRGTRQGDRERADELKAHGFRWSRNLGAWYLNPRWRYATRDARVRDLLIELEFRGYPVELHNEPPASWGDPDDPCVFVEDEHQGMHFCLVHPGCAALPDEPLPEGATFVQPGSAAALGLALAHLDGQPAHVDYPHEPGTLYDCPAWEARCQCTPGHIECVFDGPHRDVTDPDRHLSTRRTGEYCTEPDCTGHDDNDFLSPCRRPGCDGYFEPYHVHHDADGTVTISTRCSNGCGWEGGIGDSWDPPPSWTDIDDHDYGDGEPADDRGSPGPRQDCTGTAAPAGVGRTGAISGEITGLSDALTLTETWERETEQALAQLEATTAALERAEAGPELTGPFTTAMEAFTTAHEAFVQARSGLQDSVSVADAYRAAPGAGNKNFLTS